MDSGSGIFFPALGGAACGFLGFLLRFHRQGAAGSSSPHSRQPPESGTLTARDQHPGWNVGRSRVLPGVVPGGIPVAVSGSPDAPCPADPNDARVAAAPVLRLIPEVPGFGSWQDFCVPGMSWLLRVPRSLGRGAGRGRSRCSSRHVPAGSRESRVSPKPVTAGASSAPFPVPCWFPGYFHGIQRALCQRPAWSSASPIRHCRRQEGQGVTLGPRAARPLQLRF